MNIDALPTPCLLLDVDKLEANLDRFQATARRLNVRWRPHLKTCKSPEIGQSLQARGITAGAVSTLKEADTFLKHGWRDVLYAVPLTGSSLAAGLDIAAPYPPGALQFTVENPQAATWVTEVSEQRNLSIQVWIEVDCGAGRTGCGATAESLDPILAQLGAAVQVVGVFTHAGHAYGASNEADIQAIAEEERAAAVQAQAHLVSRGYASVKASVGSTPTALFAQHLTGVDEFRPGVGMFFDLFQAGLGVCSEADIAIRVLSRVIAVDPARKRAWIDAGQLAMSGDLSANRFDKTIGYGKICTAKGEPLESVFFEAVHQEHGFLRWDATQCAIDLKVGDLISVLPNHACITAAMHDHYHVVKQHRVIDQWSRVGGW